VTGRAAGAAGGARTVLGIAGSPRRHGNSERLLDACLEGALAAGSPVEKLVVVEYGIEACRGCNACSSTGACVLPDRMHEVYPRLDSAGAIVVASPVFFASVPAALKAMFDRCQPYWARRYVLHEPAPQHKRPGALLLAAGGGDPYGSECAVTTTKSVFAVLGVRMRHEVVVEGVDSPSDIGRRVGALDSARDVGAALASGAY
jgi:multimeric flavodoxin WrbA